MKTIVVSFDENGDPIVRAENFIGPSCQKATKFVENGLGVVFKDDKAPEYFEYLNTKQNDYIKKG